MDDTTSTQDATSILPYTPPLPDQDTITQANRQMAESLSDVTLPLYPSGNEQRDRYLFEVPIDAQQPFTEACRNAAPDLSDAYCMDEDDLDVLVHALLLLTRELPAECDQNLAPLVWAWVRCIMAGAGYKAHPILVEKVGKRFSHCPMDPDETHMEWTKALAAAHGACGYPAGFAWLDYGEVSRMWGTVAVPASAVAHLAPPVWMNRLALIHMVKHTRMCYHDDYEGVVVRYRSSDARFKVSASGEAIQSSKVGAMCDALGVRSTGLKSPHEPSIAVARTICATKCHQLMHTQSAALLDPHNIVAPNAHLTPWPANRTGFVRTGMGVEGVWFASGGHVRMNKGSHKLVLTTRWPRTESKDVTPFAAMVPKAYSMTAFPSASLAKAFPNLESSWCSDPQAWHAWVSAVILSGVMRHPCFRREHPFLVCSPASDDLTYSTGTGKTSLATALGQVFAPGIETAIRVGQGAPAQRAVASQIERHGTVVLDEFIWPKDDASVTSETNMMALATGGGLAPGKVMENNPDPVFLSSPLSLTAKVWDGKDDLFKRTVPFYLTPFTSAQAKASVFSEIATGEWSLRVRLECLHLIDTVGLNTLMDNAKPAGALTHFPYLRHLAIALLSLMQSKNASTPDQRIDRLIVEMVSVQQVKLEAASASGMRQEAKGVGRAIISLNGLMADLSPSEFETMRAECGAEFEPRRLFEAYRMARGRQNASDAAVFEEITGDHGVTGIRISRAVAGALRKHMLNPGDEVMCPGANGVIDGWHLRRLCDRAHYQRYEFIQKQPQVVSPAAVFAPTNTPKENTHETTEQDASSH